MKRANQLKEKIEDLRAGRLPQVNASTMYRDTAVGDVPGVEERVVLRLARAIHASESTFCVTSWSAQERAADYFNERGLGEALDFAARLEAQRLPGADN